MLNFLGALSSLLPGYIQGRRQAIQDNWQDLQNYNNIQAGQQANAFTEATWQPRLDMFYDNARLNNLRLLQGGMGTALMAAGFPRQYWNAQMGNMYGPAIDNMNYMAQLRAYQLGLSNNPGELLQRMRPEQQGLNPAPSSTQQIGG